MIRRIRFFAIFLVGIALFCSCSKKPDHARYIPKDALVVTGINLKSLSKKLAWNVITGSKLYKDIQKRMPSKNSNEALSGIEKSGIDFLNTIYLYAKTDKRLKGERRFVILIPLSDDKAWENYLMKVEPKIGFVQKADRKETRIANVVYAAWNKKLIAITNIESSKGRNDFIDYSGQNNKPSMDDAEISAEMDKVFGISNDNSILTIKKFNELEMVGHDITLWLNYDLWMSENMNSTLSNKMGGIGLANSNILWKNAAFASGIDFNSGKISGDMKYYVSDSLIDLSKEIGSSNADKGMMERMPGDKLDLFISWHLSTNGFKKSVEKLGVLGLLNEGLQPVGLNFDSVMSSFTGDFALTVNDLNIKNLKDMGYLNGERVSYNTQKPILNVTFSLKIANKDNFNKLFNLFKDLSGLKTISNDNYCMPLSSKDSVYITLDKGFAVASNKLKNVRQFVDGGSKDKNSEMINLSRHPMAMFLDIHQLAKNLELESTSSKHDSAIISVSKNLLDNISFSGGEFQTDAFLYHLDINFSNKDENSLLSLWDYGMRLSELENPKSSKQ